MFEDAFEGVGKFVTTLADKDPMVIVALIVILLLIIFVLLIRKSSNSDSFDHKEKASLISLTAQTLEEQRETRKEMIKAREQHEIHQKERVGASDRTTSAVELQNKAFKDYHVSIVETIDLAHMETINKLGGIETVLQEVRDFIKRFPEMETKVSNILNILEEMKASQNVIR